MTARRTHREDSNIKAVLILRSHTHQLLSPRYELIGALLISARGAIDSAFLAPDHEQRLVDKMEHLYATETSAADFGSELQQAGYHFCPLLPTEENDTATGVLARWAKATPGQIKQLVELSMEP